MGLNFSLATNFSQNFQRFLQYIYEYSHHFELFSSKFLLTQPTLTSPPPSPSQYPPLYMCVYCVEVFPKFRSFPKQ